MCWLDRGSTVQIAPLLAKPRMRPGFKSPSASSGGSYRAIALWPDAPSVSMPRAARCHRATPPIHVPNTRT